MMKIAVIQSFQHIYGAKAIIVFLKALPRLRPPDIKDRVGTALSLMLRSHEKMKTGDYVFIYRDPVTKIVPEGKAILVEKLPGSPHHLAHLEVWLVKMDTGEEKICYISE